MQLLRAILTPLWPLLLATTAPFVQAQNRGDDTLLEMQQAFRAATARSSNSCCPPHAATPWSPGRLTGSCGCAWARASPAEIQAFFAALRRHLPGRPPAQRLVAAAGPAPRLERSLPSSTPATACRTTSEVRCYAPLIDPEGHGARHGGGDDVRSNWYASATPTTAAPMRRASCMATSSSRPTGVRRCLAWRPTAPCGARSGGNRLAWNLRPR